MHQLSKQNTEMQDTGILLPPAHSAELQIGKFQMESRKQQK